MTALSLLPMLPSPTIIDVEASGFGPDSYPIEIGVSFADGQKYCTLIAPAADWVHWDVGAEAVHHIPREKLVENGAPIRVVVAKLNDLLRGMTIYTDGWAVDYPWIRKLFAACGLEPSFRVSPLEMILSEDQMERWHATKDDVQRELNFARHRASNDAEVIRKTWIATRDAA